MKKADDEEHRDDRDVVGLADDLAKVVVGHGQRHEQNHAVEDDPRDRGLDELFAEPDDGGKEQDRPDEIQLRVRERVDLVLERQRQSNQELIGPGRLGDVGHPDHTQHDRIHGPAGEHADRVMPFAAAKRPEDVHAEQQQVQPADAADDFGS